MSSTTISQPPPNGDDDDDDDDDIGGDVETVYAVCENCEERILVLPRLKSTSTKQQQALFHSTYADVLTLNMNGFHSCKISETAVFNLKEKKSRLKTHGVRIPMRVPQKRTAPCIYCSFCKIVHNVFDICL